jgi:hypothetical protein
MTADRDSGKQKNKGVQKMVQWTPDFKPEPKFTEHEVDEIIGTLDQGKCPGSDGIDCNIVQRLHKYLPKFWWELYNKCFALGCFPKVWKTARAIAIPKVDRTKLSKVEGYRGISLLSIPGKWLEKLVTGWLNYFLATSGQTSPLQFGFTASRSTADAIKTVIDFVRTSRKRGLKSCLLALDIAGAFDNAWHARILAQLRKLNCPQNTYNIVEDFLRDRTAHVKIGSSLSTKKVTKGCPQGSVSGPTPWNIIVGDLIKTLSKETNVKIVVFADDIMIMMQGQSLTNILNTLETTLQGIEKWCKENRLNL